MYPCSCVKTDFSMINSQQDLHISSFQNMNKKNQTSFQLDKLLQNISCFISPELFNLLLPVLQCK